MCPLGLLICPLDSFVDRSHCLRALALSVRPVVVSVRLLMCPLD
ncbi:MAG: hypothetical protein PHR96_04875 [Clostridia bacterium]|nr:hypothetical protein [Clostridia bacterium]